MEKLDPTEHKVCKGENYLVGFKGIHSSTVLKL